MVTGVNSTTRRTFILRSVAAGGVAVFAADALAACGDGGASAGGSIDLGVAQDVQTFNPDFLSFANFIYTRSIYDTLISYNDDLEPVSRLAESFELSDDGQSITVRLREGLTFQGGRKLDGEAIRRNVEFSKDPESGLSVAGILARVESLDVMDPRTVRFTLTGPTPALAATDVLEAMPIIDPRYLGPAGEDLKNRGGGAGPFAFEQWTPGNRLTLRKFDGFYEEALPRLDSVVYHIFQNAQSMVGALRAGTLDAAVYVPPNLVDALASDYDVIEGHPGALTYCFNLNAVKPPFDNKQARHAMQHAVNRQAIVDNVLFGHSAPVVLPWSTSSPAYDESALDTYPYDLQRAKEMLEGAGVAAGTKIDCLCSSAYPDIIDMAELLKADLRKIDYDLNIQVNDATTFFATYSEGNFQMTGTFNGYFNKYPTQCTVNSNYRTENNPPWGNGEMPAAWVDALAAADEALTEANQQEAFAAMNDALLDEAWIVNLAFRQSLFALSKSVTGFELTLDDMIRLEKAQVDA